MPILFYFSEKYVKDESLMATRRVIGGSGASMLTVSQDVEFAETCTSSYVIGPVGLTTPIFSFKKS